MNSLALPILQTSLQIRLWLSRFGVSNSVAAILMILGGMLWLWAIPELKTHNVAGQLALQKAKKALVNAPIVPIAPIIPQSEQHLREFYNVLGESRYAEQQIKTLFAIAAKHNLILTQAEYKFAYDKNGLFHTYMITLPVKGPYTAIRPFCEQVLLAIPFASLDEVTFKREAIGMPMLETKLRFTLYLDNASTAGNRGDFDGGDGSNGSDGAIDMAKPGNRQSDAL